MTKFLLLWAGQSLSIAGTALATFGMAIWIGQRAGSTTVFTTTMLVIVAPGVLLSPFAGVVADRFDRRRLLMWCDAVGGLLVLAAAVLASGGLLRVWHVGLIGSLLSIIAAVQLPALGATVAMLVPRAHMGRANGLLQLSHAASQIAAPIAAGFAIAAVGVTPILIADVVSFACSFASLALLRVPLHASHACSASARSFRHDVVSGWEYERLHPTRLWILAYISGLTMAVGTAQAVLTPLVLAIDSPPALGMVLSCGGAGMLTASILMSAWGGPRSPAAGILPAGLLVTIGLAAAGIRPSVALIAASMAAVFFGMQIVSACAQTYWQITSPPEILGRTLALRRTITRLGMPIGFAIAGPLVDYVLEPLSTSRYTQTLVHVIVGAGAARGIGLLLLLAGAIGTLVTLVAWVHPVFARAIAQPDFAGTNADAGPAHV